MVNLDHSDCANDAAWTAASTSEAFERVIVPITKPVAGLMLLIVRSS